MKSIVDYIKNKGGDSSFKARKELAKSYGIVNYKGTMEQNIALLDLISQEEKDKELDKIIRTQQSAGGTGGIEVTPYKEDYISREAVNYLNSFGSRPAGQGKPTKTEAKQALEKYGAYVDDKTLERFIYRWDLEKDIENGKVQIENPIQTPRSSLAPKTPYETYKATYQKPKGSKKFNEIYRIAKQLGARVFSFNGQQYSTK